MKMSKEKSDTKKTFSPQYFIINKSEPQYDLIKKQLLATNHCPDGGRCTNPPGYPLPA